jgi:hypothetical protein
MCRRVTHAGERRVQERDVYSPSLPFPDFCFYVCSSHKGNESIASLESMN